MSYDLSNDLVTLTPEDYSKGVFQTVKDLYENVTNLASKHNSLDGDVENALNDLQGQIDDLAGGDLDDLKAKVKALKELLGEGDAEDQFLDVIDIVNKLVDAINVIRKTDTYEYLFNSDSGEVVIDLGQYNFPDTSKYQVMVSLNGEVMAPVTLQALKVDEKSAKVIARDLRHFAELNVKYVDGAEQDDDGNYPNAFPFTIMINYEKDLIDKYAPREPVERA